MRKTIRVPFTDKTNNVNMKSAKKSKQNSDKTIKNSRNTAKKSEENYSRRNLRGNSEKIVKNASDKSLKTVVKSNTKVVSNSSPVKPKKTKQIPKIIPKAVSNCCNDLQKVKTSKDNASGKNVKTSKKSQTKLVSKSTPNKPKNNKQIGKIPLDVSKSPSNLPKGKTVLLKNNVVGKRTSSSNAILPSKSSEQTCKINLEDFCKSSDNLTKNSRSKRSLQDKDLGKNGISTLNKSESQESQQIKHNSHAIKLKQLKVILTRLTTVPKGNIPNKQQETIKPVQKVTFNLNLQSDNNKLYNLRRAKKVIPKYNDSEDSLLDTSSNKSNLKNKDTTQETVQVYKKPNPDCVPIYKKPIPELLKEKPQSEDLYEFTDFSPTETKKVAKNRRAHNSSIIFDKDTHKIMRKLEEKEAKTRKQVQRKKKTVQSYDKIISGIVSNVIEKITKKQQSAKNLLMNTIDENDIEVELINSSSKVPSSNIVPKITEYVSLREKLLTTSNTNVAITKPVPDIPSTSTNGSQSSILQTLDNPEIALRKELPTTSTPNKKQNITNYQLNLPSPNIPSHSLFTPDNTITQKDINSCFGFDNEPLPETNVNILSNITLESPLNFNARRPDANSTMVSKPLRTEGPRMSYFYCKDNAIPTINQEILIDHTMAETVQNTLSKIPRPQETPPKKSSAVQQSILDYVESNVDRSVIGEKNGMLYGSLYDYEEFNTPEKKKKRKTEEVGAVKRNLLGATASGSHIKRKPLGDISNSSGETTYFGFDNNTLASPTKTPREQNVSDKNDENAKPSRFSVNKMKIYTKKKDKQNQSIYNEIFENNSISIMPATEDVEEVHLFEEPEEMLDNMPQVEIHLKKHRRKRRNSCESDDCEKKRHAKKTKLDVEAEAWVQNFNEMCENIEKHQLDIV